LYNRNNIKDAEYQNNLNIIEENIRAIVKKTFRDFIPFDEIFKQIEDNLSDNVHQYKDTDAKSVDVEITKKKKKHPTDIKADEESEAEDDDEESEAEEDEAEDDEESEAEEDEAEDDEESEEDEAEEAEEDEAEEAEEDEAEDEEDDEAEDKNEVEAEATKETKKTDNDTEVSKDTNNKIHNIVDIKYSDDKTDETVEPRKTFASQEISFEAPEAVEADETSLPSSIHKEWDTIKDEYSSLSQNKMAYKTFDKKKYDKSDKSDNYDDDAISIASHTSGISNITDISHIKQIHITDTNKSKKPTFF
jgi:hypothetical protein